MIETEAAVVVEQEKNTALLLAVNRLVELLENGLVAFIPDGTVLDIEELNIEKVVVSILRSLGILENYRVANRVLPVSREINSRNLPEDRTI